MCLHGKIISAAGAYTWAEKKTIKKRMHKVTHLKAQTDQSEDREPNGDKNNRCLRQPIKLKYFSRSQSTSVECAFACGATTTRGVLF